MDNPPESSSIGSTSSKPGPLQRMPTEQSLESFSIQTTPFHDSDEDGEYYMDEAGNWLQRWVTKTEVKAVKAVRSRPDSGFAMDRGNTGRQSPIRSSTQASEDARMVRDTALESSESSAEQRHEMQEQASRGRPAIRRSSGSSFITTERANHRSPVASMSRPFTSHASAETTPRPDHVTRFAACSPEKLNILVPMADTLADNASCLETANRTSESLSSCSVLSRKPVSPSLHPSPTLAQNPRPLLHTRTATAPQPSSRRGSITVSRLERTSTMPSVTSLSTVIAPSEPLSGASSYARLRTARAGSVTGDPYIAHREALAIFGRQGLEKTRESKATERKERRVMTAADFLASRPEEIIPMERPGSKSSGEGTLRSVESLEGVLALKDIEAGRHVVLRDHDVTIDWTHPETRRRREEKERRKRTGFRGTMRKMVSCFSGDGGEGGDAGSVRRLKLQ